MKNNLFISFKHEAAIDKGSWAKKKESYCAELISSLQRAITQAIGESRELLKGWLPSSSRSCCMDVNKFNRVVKRQAILEDLKRKAEDLKTTANPGNTIQYIIGKVDKNKELWAGTTLLDRSLFWINKLVNLFGLRKSASLFHSQYEVLTQVENQAKSINSFLRTSKP